MPTKQSKTGQEAEERVAHFLEKSGYRVLDRNWRRPWGELDIVAMKGSRVHFVEVKAAARHQAGFEPWRHADHAKVRKVHRTARTWLVANRYGADTEWQIDVASVIMDQDQIEVFENIHL